MATASWAHVISFARKTHAMNNDEQTKGLWSILVAALTAFFALLGFRKKIEAAKTEIEAHQAGVVEAQAGTAEHEAGEAEAEAITIKELLTLIQTLTKQVLEHGLAIQKCEFDRVMLQQALDQEKIVRQAERVTMEVRITELTHVVQTLTDQILKAGLVPEATIKKVDQDPL